MSELSKNNFDPKKEFFIIDSERLDEVTSKIYGFCIVDGVITDDLNYLGDVEPDGTGAYVYIKRCDDQIIIKQDFVGCFGIYIYKDGDYFALSNSFVYLLDYVKTRRKITFNKTYADYFLTIDFCSSVYADTAVNEISIIDRSAQITINISDKSISTELTDYKENTVDIDSEEGIRLLDAWYHKWTKLIKGLCDNGEDIIVDLSGGFDSRVTFLLVLKSGIDLNKIKVNSTDDNLHTHSEDFEIASQIAEHFGFVLNNNNAIAQGADNYSYEDAFNISWYLKALFHKQFYFKTSRSKKPKYLFSGLGGELIGGHFGSLVSETNYIEKAIKRLRQYHVSLYYNEYLVESMLLDGYANIKEKCGKYKDRKVCSELLTTTALYRETINRNHFGKIIVENYYGNAFSLPPLLDMELNKITAAFEGVIYEKLIYAVIYDRYCPDLLEFKFEGNRSISPQVLKIAKAINKTFPYLKPNDNSNSGLTIKLKPREMKQQEKISSDALISKIKKAFLSDETKSTFLKYYNEDVYNYIADVSCSRKFHPLQDAYAVLGICKVLNDISLNKILMNETSAKYIFDVAASESGYSCVQNPLVNYYATSRIDIKNIGSAGNDVHIIELSDKKAEGRTPGFLCDEKGVGHILCSKAGRLSFTLKCIKSGSLNVILRSLDIRNANGNRVAVWLDYNRFTCNGKVIFDDTHSIWHDKFFKFTKKVEDGEIVEFEIEWTPFDIRKQYVDPSKQEDNSAKNTEKLTEGVGASKADQQNSLNHLDQKIESIETSGHTAERLSSEILWSAIFNNTISNSDWLKDKKFSPGRWAAGYPFLYALYRVLDEWRPQNILELGLGQTTKMISQYALSNPAASDMVVEHDPEWISFYEKSNIIPQNVKVCQLQITYNGTYKDDDEVCAYEGLSTLLEGKKFDLICVDAPFGGKAKKYSRVDILKVLPDCLAKSFVIFVDDSNRDGEKATIHEILTVLDKSGIKYYTGEYKGQKFTYVITSEDLKFFCSM